MTARKKAEPIEAQAPELADTPAPGPSKSSAKGGLAELQTRADQITAKGYTGPEKESTND